jgi:o-succinylbenzoate synthase
VIPSLDDLLSTARVVALPLRQQFRGIDVREALVLEGPEGWTEFSPFVEYDDAEATPWLAAAIDFGWSPTPALTRDRVLVNATLPAVGVDRVGSTLDRFPGCRTVKVKVAERGQELADDIARVRAARAYLGSTGRVRVDANGGWNVDEAEHAIRSLAEFDLEYVEQPCASVEELAEVRERIADLGVLVAADESVRKASDPLAVARAGAADLLVIKAQPLGGVANALAIVAKAGLPVVISSALDTSIGISMGLHLAGAVPSLEFDCGLATAALLEQDVTDDRLLPVDGGIDVRRVVATSALLDAHAANAERTEWWLDRLRRTYRLLEPAD